MLPNHFISVDWGTTNLRVSVVHMATLQTIATANQGFGIKALHQKWQLSGGDKEQYFLQYLNNIIQTLCSPANPPTMVIISGMASSSIGFKTLPYAQLPFRVNGSNVVAEVWQPVGYPCRVMLVSGVQSNTDVLRGEEVQLMGMHQPGTEALNLLYLLPGTHSKHLYCRHGSLYHFATFMTGELFNAITQHTLLNESVAQPDANVIDWPAFDAGVQTAQLHTTLLHSMFTIRTNTLFKKQSPGYNYYYLSGLLIGEELASITPEGIDGIVLGAAEPLMQLYNRALQLTGQSSLLQPTDHHRVNHAVIRGHALLLQAMINRQ